MSPVIFLIFFLMNYKYYFKNIKFILNFYLYVTYFNLVRIIFYLNTFYDKDFTAVKGDTQNPLR